MCSTGPFTTPLSWAGAKDATKSTSRLVPSTTALVSFMWISTSCLTALPTPQSQQRQARPRRRPPQKLELVYEPRQRLDRRLVGQGPLREPAIHTLARKLVAILSSSTKESFDAAGAP